jgi:hypothetical protein
MASNEINILNQEGNIVSISTTDTNVIQVVTAGPQGPKGDSGTGGGNIDTGSFITNSQTGSFATTGSNTFKSNQIITGSITATIGITGSLYNEGFSKNRTTTGSLNIIKQYQSIFNPSDLLIQENDIFIVEQNAEYYVLGDVINSGSLVVDGVFKIGGAFNNPGSLTGNGIIE